MQAPDIASFMRELAAARAANKIDRAPMKALIERIGAVCPRVVCQGCQGTLGGCTVCHDRGVVCPTCGNAGWLRTGNTSPGSETMRACRSCKTPAADGYVDDDTRRTFAIEQALYAAGVHLEPITVVPLEQQAADIFGDALEPVAAAPAKRVTIFDDDDQEGQP